MQYVDILALKSEFMRVLAHPLRIWIVEVLGDKKMSVGEICKLLNKEQATVSKHLGVLKNGGILKSEKSGLNVFYSVDICCLPNFLECLKKYFRGKSSQKLRKCKRRHKKSKINS